MKNRSLGAMLIAAFAFTLLGYQLPAMGEDTDLFVGIPPAASDAPNVLIILDNTGNWSAPFDNEMAALINVLEGLPENKFRVGLMMFTETGSGDSGEKGAYVRAAVRLMTGDPVSGSGTKTKYAALVSGLGKNADKGNSGLASKAMEEAYLYYAGLAPYAGNNKNKTDYTGNEYGTDTSKAIYALSGNALTSKGGTSYLSPLVEAGCTKNYIIYISNNAAQDSASDNNQARAALAAVGGNTTTIPLSPSVSQSNMADEWARFMKQSPLGIVTYTIDINKVTTGQGPGWTAVLKSMANVSSGKYFDVVDSGTQLVDTFTSIFSEIQSVSSVFASVSLPVSVSAQGTYLNQVFVGMFRPDPDSFPRWPGNLKQYKLGVVGSNLQLQDANGNGAVKSNTGFISECARSFWTPSTVDEYWSPRPMGTCLTVTNSDVSNYPDGDIVEKGAQAFKLRSTTPASRNVKACDASCGPTLANFDKNNSAITKTLLGNAAMTDTERENIINWARGLNNKGDEFGAANAIRPYVHGDVVHSRPVAINYGTDADPQIVVYYGANDGMLRAVNGNQTTNPTGSTMPPPGTELWSFVPPEFYPSLKRLRDNTPTVSYPGHTTGSPTPQPKPYGFDGPVTAYTFRDASNEFHAWIYATMRRGGRVLYAFDVSDPASPTLKWKIGCPNNLPSSDEVDLATCTLGFHGIGQTWSQPKVIKVSGYKDLSGNNKPIIIMGGGYDTCEDVDSTTATCTSPKGNKIYVLDAETGVLLKTLNTNIDRSVVADLTVVPQSSTGEALFAYAADMGGNLYRITMGNAAPGSWYITKVASLGCDTVSSCTPNRKFMFAPDVVDENGTYNLLVGSGDREKPLASYTQASSVVNYFFRVNDRPSDATWLTSESGRCGGANVICLNSLCQTPVVVTDPAPYQNCLANRKGWYLALSNEVPKTTATSPAKVVTSAITVFGVTTFSTHQPSVLTAASCSANLGTTKVYNINYIDASSENNTNYRYQLVAGGGLPPSPVAGRVMINGDSIPFVIGANPDSPLESKKAPQASKVKQPKSKVYWYLQQ